MTAIFKVCDATPYLDDAKREMLASMLPESRGERIRSPKNKTLCALRAAGEVALRSALKQLGENHSALAISYTSLGKPYVVGRDDLAVSFSHSGLYACVYVVKTPDGTPAACGVDIEKVVPLEEKHKGIATRFLPSVKVLTPEDFFTAWTKTEALVKLTGEGMGGAQEVAQMTDVVCEHRTLTHPNGDVYIVCTAHQVGL